MRADASRRRAAEAEEEGVDRCREIEEAWQRRRADDEAVQGPLDVLDCQQGCRLRHERLHSHCVEPLRLARGSEPELRETGADFASEGLRLEAWCAQHWEAWLRVPVDCEAAEGDERRRSCEAQRAELDSAFRSAVPPQAPPPCAPG